MNLELVNTFAEKQSHYTGANNKRKWIITNPRNLESLLIKCNKKPAELARLLDTSYATTKRWLTLAGLWDIVKINSTSKGGGRKRTATEDRFGYLYADAAFDIRTDTGEIKRRFEHTVKAEIKIGRPLEDREIVHHIDLDKKNNDPSNLFVCSDNKHHRKIHGQLERLAGELVRLNIIGFDELEAKYYIKDR